MKSFKNILGVSIVSAMLLFSGCGSTDSDAENSMTAQQYIDNQDYASAIALLEPKTNKTDGDYMMLSSAYMGEAGFSFSEILKIIAVTGLDTTTTQASASIYKASSSNNNDNYVNFLDEVEKRLKVNPTALEYFDKAKNALNNIQNKSDNVKFNLGLTLTMKASSTFTYLGDIAALAGNAEIDNVIKDDFIAYGCAIAKIYANTQLGSCNSVTVGPSTISYNNQQYKLVSVTLSNGDGRTFYKLANSSGSEVILTNGVCSDDTNYQNGCVVADDNATNIPKPVATGDITIKQALLDTINEGFDTLIELAPDDTKQDIIDYRSEIDNGDGNITADEIADYIDKQIN